MQNPSHPANPQSITLVRPDDWHLHLRDGPAMANVLPHTARQFARAIVMPNLRPPIVTTAKALAYRERIMAALPKGMRFEPLMTLYLTDNTPVEEIHRAKQSGMIHAALAQRHARIEDRVRAHHQQGCRAIRR